MMRICGVLQALGESCCYTYTPKLCSKAVAEQQTEDQLITTLMRHLRTHMHRAGSSTLSVLLADNTGAFLPSWL